MNILKDVRDQMRPVPADFAPEIQATDKAIFWRGKVTVSAGSAVERLQLEIGRSATALFSDLILRQLIWEAHEAARLGRADLLAIYRVDRHKMRPKPKAQPQALAPAT